MKARRDVFQAIADPTRRTIIAMIAQKPVNVNTIAEQFGVSRQAISLHLKILAECGLLNMKQQGRERVCEAKLEKLNEVNEWVTQYKQFWEAKLDALGEFLTNTKNQNNGQEIVVIERTYEAPIEKVWEALTSKDQMKHWYFEVSDFKPEVGFEFQFSAESEGKVYVHRCTVVEAEPITKMAYTWSYAGYVGESLVTFELFSEAENKTRLKLTHSDLDTFPKDNPEFSPECFNEGWKSILGQSLRNFVETDSFAKSIRIRASLKTIWDIVLKPDNQWGLAFGGGATAETDWKEGSPIIWRDTKNNIGANGVVEVHRPEAYLQLHYYDEVEPKPGATLGDYYENFSIAPDQDECILSIEIGKMAKSDIPFHQKMWEEALNTIKECAEKVSKNKS